MKLCGMILRVMQNSAMPAAAPTRIQPTWLANPRLQSTARTQNNDTEES